MKARLQLRLCRTFYSKTAADLTVGQDFQTLKEAESRLLSWVRIELANKVGVSVC